MPAVLCPQAQTVRMYHRGHIIRRNPCAEQKLPPLMRVLGKFRFFEEADCMYQKLSCGSIAVKVVRIAGNFCGKYRERALILRRFCTLQFQKCGPNIFRQHFGLISVLSVLFDQKLIPVFLFGNQPLHPQKRHRLTVCLFKEILSEPV